MATNGAQEAFAPDDVLGAVMTMRNGEQETKKKAHAYLERFQKSVCPFVTYLNLFGTDTVTERFLGNHYRHFAIQSRARSYPFCSHYSSRQGMNAV